MRSPNNPDGDRPPMSATELYLAGGGNLAKNPRTAEILRMADESHERQADARRWREADATVDRLIATGEPATPQRRSLRSRIWPYALMLFSAIAAADLLCVAVTYPRDVQHPALTLAAGAVLAVNGIIAARSAGKDRPADVVR